ncbi:glycosyl transferase group 1 [Paenibacillus curdlanolyticus YK9]|uniref:Glycosyl transferase group 1 n=1 Tax=Paenibacillus curdlanolyticus YK9 TaxID=717606 RepID=E0IFM1_9BACL|nr:glycosyl transferase group 1 [Paenibacillus curdlanolyticus YK9]
MRAQRRKQQPLASSRKTKGRAKRSRAGAPARRVGRHAGFRRSQRLRRQARLQRKPAPALQQTAEPQAPLYEGAPGVQLIGFSRAESGVGEACRLQAASLLAANVPTSIVSCDALSLNRTTDLSTVSLEQTEPLHRCSILQFNPDMLPHVFARYGHRLVERKYTVGYWHWELHSIPDEWANYWPYFQEIWTPSAFVREAIAAKSPLPVITMPYGCMPDDGFRPGRFYYGLPQEPFLFVTMFDTYSFIERKNPIGALEAFLQAFGRHDPSVGLVIKVNNAHNSSLELERLKQRMVGSSNVYYIEAGMTRKETGGLLAACNAYVSLHRAEGFGLGIAEAMARGKPAISTDWSGSTELVQPNTGCPVRYTLTPITQTIGPYEAGNYWAEPDIEHAAGHMRRLASDRAACERLGTMAAHSLHARFHPLSTGQAMKQRLQTLGLLS